ncbi:MAG: hypothetical protein RIC03_17575 [Cyclobacteriaceae bacterium]
MKTIKITLVLGLMVMTGVCFAQGAPPATPIDGGLSLLLVGGAAYGIKKLAEKKK